MRPTLINIRLLHRYIEQVKTVYSEPENPEFLGSIFGNEISLDFGDSEETHKAARPKLSSKRKDKIPEENKNQDIREMFRQASSSNGKSPCPPKKIVVINVHND